MIVVDANYFLRSMTSDHPDANPALVSQAQALFLAAETGLAEFTTSEAVIAEVAFVLVKEYGVERASIAETLIELLELRGCRMPTRRECSMALRFWANHTSLDFVDALLSALAEQTGAQLATLDRRLARLTNAPVWSPDETTA